MGLIFILMLGAILGWIATIVLRFHENHELTVNVVTGVGGALLSDLVLSPMIAKGNLLAGGYSVEALLIALAGSLLFLISVNLFRHAELG